MYKPEPIATHYMKVPVHHSATLKEKELIAKHGAPHAHIETYP